MASIDKPRVKAKSCSYPMATLPTGRYTIINVRYSNLAFLEDPNDGTPLNANYNQNVDAERVGINLADSPELTDSFISSGTSTGLEMDAISFRMYKTPLMQT